MCIALGNGFVVKTELRAHSLSECNKDVTILYNGKFYISASAIFCILPIP